MHTHLLKPNVVLKTQSSIYKALDRKTTTKEWGWAEADILELQSETHTLTPFCESQLRVVVKSSGL